MYKVFDNETINVRIRTFQKKYVILSVEIVEYENVNDQKVLRTLAILLSSTVFGLTSTVADQRISVQGHSG